METGTLSALGQTLQQEFQALIGPATNGWLDDAYLATQDLAEFRAIEAELIEISWIGYKFEVLEAWLTSGFVPVNLAEGSPQPALKADILPDFRSLKDFGNFDPNLLQQDGDKPATSPPPENLASHFIRRQRPAGNNPAASSPPSDLESPSPIKGLKDLAHFLEADQPSEGASTSAVASDPETPDDFRRLDLPGEMNFPDLLKVFGLVSSFPENQEDVRPSSASSPGSAEYPFFSQPPEVTEAEAHAPPARRRDTSAQKKGTANFSNPNSSGSEFSSLVNLGQNLPASLTADFDLLSFTERLNSPGFNGEDLSALGEQAFEMPSVITHDISFWDNQPGPDTFFKDREAPRGLEFQIEADSGQSQRPGDVSELDLELILEAIAQEIQQEYKRFYGS